MSITRTCTVEGCERKPLGKTICKYHHSVKYKQQKPLYSTWSAMKYRCYNKNNGSYPNYGGRGITVCDRWLKSYDAFAEDMGERPLGGTLDRIDNDKGYSPDNCKWSTRDEQIANRRVLQKNNSTGHVNIHYNPPRRKWYIIIRREDGSKYSICKFTTKEQALQSYHSIVAICKQCDK